MTVEQDIQALRDLTREAHETIKDLRRLLREVQTAKGELERVAHDVFDERISSEVEAGLAALSTSIKQATDEATDVVFKRFDIIASQLLGEARGQVPIADIFRQGLERRRAAQ